MRIWAGTTADIGILTWGSGSVRRWRKSQESIGQLGVEGDGWKGRLACDGLVHGTAGAARMTDSRASHREGRRPG